MNDDRERDFLENYRFKSSIEEFKDAVDIIKMMLSKNQIVLLFGFIKDIYIQPQISQIEFSKEYTNVAPNRFMEILVDEILVLLETSFENSFSEDDKFEDYLKSNNLNDEVIKELIASRYEKTKYLKEMIIDENYSNRYFFKNNTITDKLSFCKYDINKYIIDDGNELSYATLKFEVSSKLASSSVPNKINELIRYSNAKKDISFVCDKNDLNYMIEILTKIANKL